MTVAAADIALVDLSQELIPACMHDLGDSLQLGSRISVVKIESAGVLAVAAVDAAMKQFPVINELAPLLVSLGSVQAPVFAVTGLSLV